VLLSLITDKKKIYHRIIISWVWISIVKYLAFKRKG